MMHVPEEEKYLQTKEELHDRLVSLLGGRAAEEIVFGNVTTGAANDIEQATNLVTNMVTRFGMSKRFGLMGLATVESEYLGGGARPTCSDRTAADVDTEIMETLKQCYEEAKELLAGNREVMDKLAAHLIEKETISGKEFMKIYRKEKGIPEPVEEDKEKEGKDSAKEADSFFDTKKQDSFFETDTAAVQEDKETTADKSMKDKSEAEEEAADTIKDQEDHPKQENETDNRIDNRPDSENRVRGRFSNASSDLFD